MPIDRTRALNAAPNARSLSRTRYFGALSQGNASVIWLLLSRRSCREFAPARSDYDRRSAIFRGRACVCQNVILPIEFIGYIAASSADPSIIKPADDERRAIRERDNFRRFINPEAQVLFGAQGSISTRRVYDDYFCC